MIFISNNMILDMTSSAASAFGSNLKLIDPSPIAFGLYGGDVDQNGFINATDVSMVDNGVANYDSGYVLTDLTGNNFVDGTDFLIADNNAAIYAEVIIP